MTVQSPASKRSPGRSSRRAPGRPGDPVRKRRVLDAASDWVMENGLAAFSLRALAGALGTSPRMLLYDFESRDGLLRAVLLNIQERQAGLVRDQLAAEPSPAAALGALWRWLTAPPQARLVRLVLEVRCAIIEGRLAADIAERWNDPYRPMFEAYASPIEDLTLIRAVVTGLLMERARGDHENADKAMARFLGVMRKR